MAELRQKTHHILLSTGGKNVTIELFPASQWPGQSSKPGEFRMRIDGKWFSGAGKYTFMNFETIARMTAQLLAGEALPDEEEAPALLPRQRVTVHSGECLDGLPMQAEQGHVVAPPHRGVDGRWYVHVSTFNGVKAYLCQDVDIFARKGAKEKAPCGSGAENKYLFA